MATTDVHQDQTSEAAIFARLWEAGEDGLSVELARHVLKIRFPEPDRARMHELAEQNQQRRLSPHEQEELDNFVKVGDLLAILQSKARKLLKQTPPSRSS
ncbi:MAG: hypothetical protein WD847_08455 [Pirellulales bacterium]